MIDGGNPESLAMVYRAEGSVISSQTSLRLDVRALDARVTPVLLEEALAISYWAIVGFSQNPFPTSES